MHGGPDCCGTYRRLVRDSGKQLRVGYSSLLRDSGGRGNNGELHGDSGYSFDRNHGDADGNGWVSGKNCDAYAEPDGNAERAELLDFKLLCGRQRCLHGSTDLSGSDGWRDSQPGKQLFIRDGAFVCDGGGRRNFSQLHSYSGGGINHDNCDTDGNCEQRFEDLRFIAERFSRNAGGGHNFGSVRQRHLEHDVDADGDAELNRHGIPFDQFREGERSGICAG